MSIICKDIANLSFCIPQIAKLQAWLKLSSHLYTLLLHTNKVSHPKLFSVLSNQKSILEVEQRFSETRCHKVMKRAEAAYQENLPEHYTAGVHQTQVCPCLLIHLSVAVCLCIHTCMHLMYTSVLLRVYVSFCLYGRLAVCISICSSV